MSDFDEGIKNFGHLFRIIHSILKDHLGRDRLDDDDEDDEDDEEAIELIPFAQAVGEAEASVPELFDLMWPLAVPLTIERTTQLRENIDRFVRALSLVRDTHNRFFATVFSIRDTRGSLFIECHAMLNRIHIAAVRKLMGFAKRAITANHNESVYFVFFDSARTIAFEAVKALGYLEKELLEAVGMNRDERRPWQDHGELLADLRDYHGMDASSELLRDVSQTFAKSRNEMFQLIADMFVAFDDQNEKVEDEKDEVEFASLEFSAYEFYKGFVDLYRDLCQHLKNDEMEVEVDMAFLSKECEIIEEELRDKLVSVWEMSHKMWQEQASDFRDDEMTELGEVLVDFVRTGIEADRRTVKGVHVSSLYVKAVRADDGCAVKLGEQLKNILKAEIDELRMRRDEIRNSVISDGQIQENMVIYEVGKWREMVDETETMACQTARAIAEANDGCWYSAAMDTDDDFEKLNRKFDRIAAAEETDTTGHIDILRNKANELKKATNSRTTKSVAGSSIAPSKYSMSTKSTRAKNIPRVAREETPQIGDDTPKDRVTRALVSAYTQALNIMEMNFIDNVRYERYQQARDQSDEMKAMAVSQMKLLTDVREVAIKERRLEVVTWADGKIKERTDRETGLMDSWIIRTLQWLIEGTITRYKAQKQVLFDDCADRLAGPVAAMEKSKEKLKAKHLKKLTNLEIKCAIEEWSAKKRVERMAGHGVVDRIRELAAKGDMNTARRVDKNARLQSEVDVENAINIIRKRFDELRFQIMERQIQSLLNLEVLCKKRTAELQAERNKRIDALKRVFVASVHTSIDRHIEFANSVLPKSGKKNDIGSRLIGTVLKKVRKHKVDALFPDLSTKTAPQNAGTSIRRKAKH